MLSSSIVAFSNPSHIRDADEISRFTHIDASGVNIVTSASRDLIHSRAHRRIVYFGQRLDFSYARRAGKGLETSRRRAVCTLGHAVSSCLSSFDSGARVVFVTLKGTSFQARKPTSRIALLRGDVRAVPPAFIHRGNAASAAR